MTVAERSINHIAVTRHPADVGCASVDVLVANVEGQLLGHGGEKKATRGRMENALRLARRTRCMENEHRVFGIHPLRLAVKRRIRHQGFIPEWPRTASAIFLALLSRLVM